MRLVGKYTDEKRIEHDPVSYFQAIVSAEAPETETGISESTEASAATLTELFRVASKRAAQRFAEARRRLAA